MPSAMEMMLPVWRCGMEPLKVFVLVEAVVMTISPLVARSMRLLKPIKPRLGTWNSSRVRSAPCCMLTSVPRRVPTYSITVPANSCGTSTVSSSTGSALRPLISL